MKRLSEFKPDGDGYRLRELKAFLEHVEAEETVRMIETQGLLFDLIELGKMAVDYAERLERGGYGD